MTEKERFRKFVRNGFRKDEELGIPYHLYCLAHAVLIAVPLGLLYPRCFMQWICGTYMVLCTLLIWALLCF